MEGSANVSDNFKGSTLWFAYDARLYGKLSSKGGPRGGIMVVLKRLARKPFAVNRDWQVGVVYRNNKGRYGCASTLAMGCRAS